ncbi:MAG: AraC family transcriptional regulator [Aquabacterium sp.]|nr:AraC family transcriptional regulator [Aquabacterium sp.]
MDEAQPICRDTCVDIRSDDPRLTEATIPTHSWFGLVGMAQSWGVNAEPWFAGQGVSVEQLNQANTLISFRQAVTVIRRGLKALPPGPLGLSVGSRDAMQTFGVLGFALMSCRTVREAFELGLRYHEAAGSMMDFGAEFGPSHGILNLYERFPERDILPFLCEGASSSLVMMARAMLGPGFAPLRVELSYAAPDHVSAYRQFFKCPVHFGAGGNRILFDVKDLDRPLPSHNPASLALALDACQRLLALAGPQQDVLASVERQLRLSMRERPGIADIAHGLNVTERTLRRQLSAAGERFCDIRDRVLEQRARALLKETSLSVSDIALELGYGDSRDFRRAFKRWTGHAPVSQR